MSSVLYKETCMRWFVALNVVFMVLYIQVYTKMDNFVPAHLAQVRCTSNRLWTRPFVTLCVFQWTYTPSPIQQTHIWSYFDSFNTYSTHSCVSYRLGRIFIVRMWCAWVKYYKIFCKQILTFFHHSRADYCKNTWRTSYLGLIWSSWCVWSVLEVAPYLRKSFSISILSGCWCVEMYARIIIFCRFATAPIVMYSDTYPWKSCLLLLWVILTIWTCL